MEWAIGDTGRSTNCRETFEFFLRKYNSSSWLCTQHTQMHFLTISYKWALQCLNMMQNVLKDLRIEPCDTALYPFPVGKTWVCKKLCSLHFSSSQKNMRERDPGKNFSTHTFHTAAVGYSSTRVVFSPFLPNPGCFKNTVDCSEIWTLLCHSEARPHLSMSNNNWVLPGVHLPNRSFGASRHALD